jgi:hypothetical protein
LSATARLAAQLHVRHGGGGIHLYLRAAELYRALRERGKTVRSTVDCSIAAIAEDGGCDLLARDRDMDAILDSGLLKALAAPLLHALRSPVWPGLLP